MPRTTVITPRIRPARDHDDAAAIARIHISSWQLTYHNLLPDAFLANMDITSVTARWWRRLRFAAAHSSDIWLIEDTSGDQSRVAGFYQIGPCVTDDSLLGIAGEVFMLYVHPAQSGRGFGRALLEHSLDVLAGRGYHWVVIWVLEKNTRARSFYKHHGLRPDGLVRLDRFAAKAVPVVRYAKPLNDVLDFEALRHGRIIPRDY